MIRCLGAVAMAAPLLAAVATAPALAQKLGGILRMYSPDSPASMSIREEATFVAEGPMMGVFNNLVMFDQHVKQNSLDSIVPDLATGWSWNEDGSELTLPLRSGVRWHDGRPFAAQDVRCTFDLLTGKASDKLRVNPRKSWYRNLDAVTTNGDYEVTFHLKRPQPAFLAALAGGASPIYPCHVPPRDMQPSDRHRPLQVRRIQAERTDRRDQKPRLLESGPALSRRHRIYDHTQPVDGYAGVCQREI
jgi:peptide/nickel transport system substrate-binding protein